MDRERIPVALLGMNERSLALLKMFFDGLGHERFELVEERHARAGIFDLDTPGAEKLWRVYHKLYGWPSIVLSVRERQLPGAIWVQKPFVLESLAAAAERLSDGLVKASKSAVSETESNKGWARLRALGGSLRARRQAVVEAAPEPAAATASKPLADKPPARPILAPATPVTPETAETAQHRPAQAASKRDGFCRETLRTASPLIKQYCGTAADLDPDVAADREQMFYVARGHFQALLATAWRKAREHQQRVLLRAMNEKYVLLCPHTGLATTNFSNKTLRSACVMRLGRQDVQAVLLADGAEAPDMPDAAVVNADALLWNVALWTSKGRLKQGIDPQAFVRLRHWPNFTRLTRTPHAMRIVALWVERGATLLDTAQLLKVPQRYVFSVFSAAEALGLVKLETPSCAPPQAAHPMPAAPHQQRGLFSRLLRRLAG